MTAELSAEIRHCPGPIGRCGLHLPALLLCLAVAFVASGANHSQTFAADKQNNPKRAG